MIFLFNSLSSNKNFLACHTNTDTSITQKDLESDNLLSLKLSSNLELLVNRFNNVTPENDNNPEKLLHLNTMILMKCITLKYLIKIDHYPNSI